MYAAADCSVKTKYETKIICDVSIRSKSCPIQVCFSLDAINGVSLPSPPPSPPSNTHGLFEDWYGTRGKTKNTFYAKQKRDKIKNIFCKAIPVLTASSRKKSSFNY